MTRLERDSDTIDLADVARSVRRGWRSVLACVLVGGLAAVAIVMFVPARFAGSSSIIVHAQDQMAGGLASKLTGAVGGLTADLLPGGLSSPPLETEVQILSSRALAGEAVDSLLLQLRVRGPERDAPWRLFQSATVPGSFKRHRIQFSRIGTAAGAPRYVVSGLDATPDTVSNGIVTSGPLSLRFDPSKMPARVDVDLYDREEAIGRVQDRLNVGKVGGEVVGVSFRGDDSLTAAAVPNLLIRRYLERRRTTDRGINQRRVEFLSGQVDSVEANLTGAERALRAQQEATGIVDPIVVGKLELERAGDLRKESGTLDIERGALSDLLARLNAGTLSSRQLAAFPTFLRSTGINDLLSQLSTLETKRLQLLATLTPQSPEVAATTDAIKNIEAQLPAMAQAYSATLERQRADVGKQLDTLQSTIAALPAVSETGLRLQRNVLRLGQVNAGMRAQLVEAKLSAIGEGGDVRLLDVAAPPRRVSFPRPVPTIAAGLGGGLMIGIVAAVLAGFFGRYMNDARSIERLVGVPALTLDAGMPLVIANVNNARVLLLVPLDARADTAGVAERLARTATTRSLNATVVDFTAVDATKMLPAPNIDRLATEFDLVLVRLPELSSEAAVSSLSDTRPVLFVASADRVDRARLSRSVESLQRLSIPCAGVVLSRRSNGRPANGLVPT